MPRPVQRQGVDFHELAGGAAFAPPGGQEAAGRVDGQDPVGGHVRDIDRAGRVGRGVDRDAEPAVAGRRALARPEERSIRCERVDAGEVGDVEVAVWVNGDVGGGHELAAPRAAEAAPGGDEATVAVELLHPVVGAVEDVDIAAGVERHGAEVAEPELALARPGRLPRRCRPRRPRRRRAARTGRRRPPRRM